MRPSAAIFSPFGHPSYSTTSDHFLSGAILKMRPNGISTMYRLPSASNDGPSMKQSVGWPGRLASAHSVATLRRNSAGTAEKIWVSISLGGVSKYIILLLHLLWRNRPQHRGCRYGRRLACSVIARSEATKQSRPRLVARQLRFARNDAG